MGWAWIGLVGDVPNGSVIEFAGAAVIPMSREPQGRMCN
jgi:hypothetical protein